MSEIRRILEVSCPGCLLRSGQTEELEVDGLRCSACGGQGWHWRSLDDYESEKVACGVCGGSGVMSARIRIEWLRSGRHDNPKILKRKNNES